MKLTIKPTAPKKAVARSSNPSQVLLLGTHPRRLERELSAAGHSVEVVPSAGAAKQKNYAIVVTDSAKAGEARTTFPGAVVMVRSGDVVADIRSVEGHVARKPKNRSTDRTVVAAPRDRKPVETGPDPDAGRKVVATIEPTEAPTPPPTKVEEPKKVETRPAVVETPREEPKKVIEPKPKVVAAAVFASEIHFGYGGWGLNGATRAALDKTSRWLTEHSDVNVLLEGHADPSGNPDANMALAESRAERVKKYLVGKGIDSGRLEVVSLGSTKLKYAASDARNRRVMIIKK